MGGGALPMIRVQRLQKLILNQGAQCLRGFNACVLAPLERPPKRVVE